MSPAEVTKKLNPVIAKKLIIYVVLFSSFLTLIITAAQLYIDYSKDIKQIYSSIDQIKNIHVRTLTSSLWATDQESIQLQLDGIIKMPDMEYIEVAETIEAHKDSKIWGVAGSKRSTNVIKNTFPLIYTNNNKQRFLGTLSVVATLDDVYDRLIDKTLTIILSNGVKTFLVSIFILAVFYRLVTRHLSNIANFAYQQDFHSNDYQELKLSGRSGNESNTDELDVLVAGINQMRQNVHEAYFHLKTSEEKYRQIVELAQEGIWRVDKNTITTYVNPAMTKILHYTPEEMTGKSLYDFMDEQGKKISDINLEIRKDGIHKQNDFEFISKQGKRVYTTMTTAPVFDDAGNYDGAIAGVMDITERRLNEEELKKYRDNLEKLVIERTQDLNNAQDELLKKERLATLGQLTATVSHELRNPLGSMKPSLFVLRKFSDPENEKMNNALNRIDRSIDRCDNIINELLDYTRTKELNLRQTNINQWLTQIINDQLLPSELKIKYDFNLDNTPVWIDQDRLHQAIANIINNGFQSMMDESTNQLLPGSTLTIRTDKESDRINITVIDNGSGINSSLLEKIFEPLFSTKGFGVGLGLPIVKQIIEQHGGGIEIQSHIDKGSMITLWLPITLEKTPEEYQQN